MQLTKTLLTIMTAFALAVTAPIPENTPLEARQTLTDIATVYYQADAYGSCGAINSDASMVASVSPSFGSNALCGRRLRVTNTAPTTDLSVGGGGGVIEVGGATPARAARPGISI